MNRYSWVLTAFVGVLLSYVAMSTSLRGQSECVCGHIECGSISKGMGTHDCNYAGWCVDCFKCNAQVCSCQTIGDMKGSYVEYCGISNQMYGTCVTNTYTCGCYVCNTYWCASARNYPLPGVGGQPCMCGFCPVTTWSGVNGACTNF